VKSAIWRALIEAGFIVFLFYSNLLTGEIRALCKGSGDGFKLTHYPGFHIKDPEGIGVQVVGA
jgi:hypothetical protein